MPSGKFYNNTTSKDIVGPNANDKCSIHHWSAHGFTGRAILLDYWAFAHSTGKTYDPYTIYSITYSDLVDCGKFQGIDIRPAFHGGDVQVGDILFIRSGFISKYHQLPPSEATQLALRGHGVDGDQTWAGLEQSQEILDWLHDCYFSAVGGDAPAFETWPTQQQYHLHEYILSLWGMPLGEMLDLEVVSEKCRERKRWTFFFTSAPANCKGGVATHPNCTAIF